MQYSGIHIAIKSGHKICFKCDAFTHYRTDRMLNVVVCEELSDKADKGRFNVAERTKRVFGILTAELRSTEPIKRNAKKVMGVKRNRVRSRFSLYCSNQILESMCQATAR